MSSTVETGPALVGNAETNPPPTESGLNDVVSDDITLQGAGTDASKLQIKAVQTDATLTGKGTVADPLSVVPGGPGTVLTDGVTIDGDGSLGSEVTIKAVQTDGTLTGSGTVADPLSVVAPTVVSDGVTLDGDGSIGDPLAIKAVQTDATLTGNGTVASPLSAVGSAPTVEHVEGVGPIVADPTRDVTFAAYNGLIPEGPLDVVITLADGEVDGFRKAIACPAIANVTYKITPANPLGFASLDSTDSGPLGATLVWDDTAGKWKALSKEAP